MKCIFKCTLVIYWQSQWLKVLKYDKIINDKWKHVFAFAGAEVVLDLLQTD